MICPHQFIHIDQTQKADASAPVFRPIFGAIAGCVLCGEIRKIFTDGTLITNEPQ